MYDIFIGDSANGHNCLVHFDRAGVRITVIHEPIMGSAEEPLRIEEYTTPAAVTLVADEHHAPPV